MNPIEANRLCDLARGLFQTCSDEQIRKLGAFLVELQDVNGAEAGINAAHDASENRSFDWPKVKTAIIKSINDEKFKAAEAQAKANRERDRLHREETASIATDLDSWLAAIEDDDLKPWVEIAVQRYPFLGESCRATEGKTMRQKRALMRHSWIIFKERTTGYVVASGRSNSLAEFEV